ncbi:FAT3-like protein [Mya arenaria]|uniref:FAT3-like protein n=1 Tax=Mya arenaria TaxID=6604 RepID=A0ABY7G4W3_MYAAR|nr:FAT3-like protein [Mya arenaria]
MGECVSTMPAPTPVNVRPVIQASIVNWVSEKSFMEYCIVYAEIKVFKLQFKMERLEIKLRVILYHINECLANPCLYGGSCFNTPGSYVCQCIEGRTGVNCEKDIDECIDLSICKNGGTCINTQGSYLCNCPPQWTGTHCDNDVDECVLGLARCENGATCINTIGGYECICPPGYTGPRCAADMYSTVVWKWIRPAYVEIQSSILCGRNTYSLVMWKYI